MAEMAKQDSRIARTIELEAIVESQGGKLLEFSEDLYTEIHRKDSSQRTQLFRVSFKKRPCF